LEYRGIEFAAVRTTPKGWVWSVKRDHGDIVGHAYDREDAMESEEEHRESAQAAEPAPRPPPHVNRKPAGAEIIPSDAMMKFAECAFFLRTNALR
jgi:hypothetical protein